MAKRSSLFCTKRNAVARERERIWSLLAFSFRKREAVAGEGEPITASHILAKSYEMNDSRFRVGE